MSEVITAVREMQTAFEQFKHLNDTRIAELEKGRTPDILLKEQIDRINTVLSDLQDQVTKAGRLPVSGASENLSPEQREHKDAFLHYVRKGHGVERLTDLAQKAMTVGSDPEGGFFVPTDMTGRIVQKVYESSPIRRYASVQSISGPSLTGVIDNDEADFGWVGEQSSRTETTTPEVGQWEIRAHGMYAAPKQTQDMLDDASVDMESWLVDKVSDKLRRGENAAFITGNGIARPRGLTTYTAVTTSDATRTWGEVQYTFSGAAADFAASNPSDKLVAIQYTLKAAYRQNAVWLMPKATLGDIRVFKNGDNDYIWKPGLEAGQPSTLLGHPVIEDEDMPAKAANAIGIVFGDLRAYQIADRYGIRVLRDPFSSKPFVVFYTTKRVGGGLVNTEAVKYFKFATS